MRFVVFIVILLPVGAKAAPLNKADCEAVYRCFEGCAAEHYNCIRSGSEAHLWKEVEARHPSFLERKILPMCEKVHSGVLSKDVAFHKFCKTKSSSE